MALLEVVSDIGRYPGSNQLAPDRPALAADTRCPGHLNENDLMNNFIDWHGDIILRVVF